MDDVGNSTAQRYRGDAGGTWYLVSGGRLVRGDLLFLSVATVATLAPALISFSFFKLINLFIFGCVGSSFLCEGFL